MNEIIKGLENLYSWAEFYKMNMRMEDWSKTQQQIYDYKRKYNLG